MQITLLVPELLWPDPENHGMLAPSPCPALEILLARGRLDRYAPRPMEAALCGLFGLSGDTPYGALRLLGEASAPAPGEGKRWLCADPVHLRLHQERLVLADHQQLGITAEEAQRLVDSLNAELPEIGRFHAASAASWYLQAADSVSPPRFDAPPLSAVAGRSVDELIPDILTDREWRRRFNDIQTLLHAHPINRQREDNGRMTINSLWLWGDGALPPRRENEFDGVWSIHPLAHGLARATGVPDHPLPVDAAALFAHAAPETHHLVIIEDLLAPVQYENVEAWRTGIAALETCWFAPLRNELASGRVAELQLIACNSQASLTWQCRRSDLWKFWRRRKTLAEIAQELDNN